MEDLLEIKETRVEVETSKAILAVINGKKWWIPKSVIHPDSEVLGLNDEGTLTVKAWFAEKEGIEY